MFLITNLSTKKYNLSFFRRKHDYMRHLGIIHDKVLAYLPEEMKEVMMRKPTSSMNMKAVEKKENKTKSAAISTKRKAENGEGQRSVKPKI